MTDTILGVKTMRPLLIKEPRFYSHPFVPVACCNTKDKDGVYMLAGYGKLYKQTSPTTWAPCGEL